MSEKNTWNGLTDWQKYVMDKLDRIDTATAHMSNDITALKVKVALFGAGSGLIAGVVVTAIARYLGA